MKLCSALLAMTLSLTAGVAHAAPAILGVQVGARLTLPQCDVSDFPLVPHDCWKSNADLGPSQANVREVFLSDQTEAHAAFIRHATVIMDGDTVAGLIILTTGVDSQDGVMQALRAKLGAPTRFKVDQLQNRMGARFSGILALWLQPGLVVRFDSTFDDLDNGELDVMTPAYAKQRDAQTPPPSL